MVELKKVLNTQYSILKFLYVQKLLQKQDFLFVTPAAFLISTRIETARIIFQFCLSTLWYSSCECFPLPSSTISCRPPTQQQTSHTFDHRAVSFDVLLRATFPFHRAHADLHSRNCERGQ